MPKGVWRGAQGPLVHSLPLEESLPALPGLNPRGAGGRRGGGRRAGASPGVSYVLKAEIFCDTLSTFCEKCQGSYHFTLELEAVESWTLSGVTRVLWIVGWITWSRFNFSFKYCSPIQFFLILFLLPQNIPGVSH